MAQSEGLTPPLNNRNRELVSVPKDKQSSINWVRTRDIWFCSPPLYPRHHGLQSVTLPTPPRAAVRHSPNATTGCSPSLYPRHHGLQSVTLPTPTRAAVRHSTHATTGCSPSLYPRHHGLGHIATPKVSAEINDRIISLPMKFLH